MRHTNRRRRIDEERARKYLGTAAIDPALVNTLRNDQISPSRGPYHHQTPAIIDRLEFQGSLSRARLGADALKHLKDEVVRLDFDPGTSIQFLQTMQDDFGPSSSVKTRNERCLLRFYSSDLSEEAKRDVIDEDLCERRSSDGELFYRLHLHWQTYKNDLDPPNNKWLGILAQKSDSKAVHARRLLNTNNPFTAAFGQFHSIPSMFWGMQLGLIGQMISMPCRDELLQYLIRIDMFWTNICPTIEIKEKVDAVTLDILTFQAPGADETQYRALGKALNENQLFTHLSPVEKNLVWSRLIESTRDRCIPTIQAFFRNLGYLSAVSYSLERLRDSIKVTAESSCDQARGKRKRLMQITQGGIRKKSLKQALSNGFQRNSGGKCLVQMSENAYRLVEAGRTDPRELGYRTLWTFCLRWHPMLPRAPTNEHQILKETFNEQPQVLAHFAYLAYKIGFRTRAIEHLIKKAVQIIAIDTQERIKSRRKPPTFSDPEEPIALGKPCAALVSEIRHKLFLPAFHNTVTDSLKLSHFFVQRSLYLDIFDCENTAEVHEFLCSGLRGVDYSIPEIGNEINPDNANGTSDQRLLAEAHEVIRKLQGDIERLEAEHSVCSASRCELVQVRAQLEAVESKNLELQARSEACLIQAQKAEAERSVAHQQLAKEREGQKMGQPTVSAYSDIVKTLQARELYQAGEQSSQDELVKSLPRREHMVWSPSVRSTHVLDDRLEPLGIHSEDQSSQYSQESIHSATSDLGRVRFQVDIRELNGSSRCEDIYVNEDELIQFINSFQIENYKLFNDEDKVLTTYTAYNLPPQQRILVFKRCVAVGSL